ncbi:MAG: 3-phosphoserine/phosphohydroxythreonine transaminase [Saprospiraceae bacterium]|nr:3-phosphoserine/phosphohydroxythreonine transaminase [Saprospiraceae bacterium]
MKKYNFSAGPAVLPREVIEKAASNVLNYNGSGFSILEVSHRSKDVVADMDNAIALVKELFGLGDEFEVLFLQGGASTQFFQVPMNLLNENETAGYVNTGAWSKKAIKEAKAFGKVNVVASSEDTNYSYIPKAYDIPSDLKYLHITTNNTIFGTQFQELPETNVPLIADMSSDIFSRPIDASKFDLIYAGAQKNMGPAGVTLVIVRKSALGTVSRYMPAMLDYKTHIENVSMYNTPPVFAMHVSMLTLEWIKSQGGLTAMAASNEAKAKILYDELDRNSLFYGHAVKEDRSLMNVTFRLHNEEFEAEFLDRCKKEGLDGLKGHRSVGGFRASIYNALEAEGIQKLADLMRAFEAEKA